MLILLSTFRISTASFSARSFSTSLISPKTVMVLDVYSNTITVFGEIKEVLKERAEKLAVEILKVDRRINIFFKEISLQAMQLKIAGDILDFQMHSNVFEFDRSHAMFKT